MIVACKFDQILPNTVGGVAMHVNCGQMDSGTLPGYKWEFGQNQDVFFTVNLASCELQKVYSSSDYVHLQKH